MEGGVAVGIGTIYTVVAGLLGAMALAVGAVWRVLQTSNEARIKAKDEEIARLTKDRDDSIARLVQSTDATIARERERGDRWEAMWRAVMERLEYSLDLGGAPRLEVPSDRRTRRAGQGQGLGQGG